MSKNDIIIRELDIERLLAHVEGTPRYALFAEENKNNPHFIGHMKGIIGGGKVITRTADGIEDKAGTKWDCQRIAIAYSQEEINLALFLEVVPLQENETFLLINPAKLANINVSIKKVYHLFDVVYDTTSPSCPIEMKHAKRKKMRVPVSYTGAVPDDVLPLLRAVAYNTHWKCELSHLHCISFSVSGKPNLDQDILEALCVCDKARARVSYTGSVIGESERWEVNAAYQALQLLPEIDARCHKDIADLVLLWNHVAIGEMGTIINLNTCKRSLADTLNMLAGASDTIESYMECWARGVPAEDIVA